MRAKPDAPKDQQLPTDPDATPSTTTTVPPEIPPDVTGTPPAPEEFKRPESLYFIGERLPSGEPVEHLAGYGIDARDYPKGDPWLARLTDDQLKLALDSKLYQRSEPNDRKAEGDDAQDGKD
jgi:hypothetical protein